jgi:hypothetical protein
MKYTIKTEDVTGDTFTQLLGVNDAGTIVGYHGATVNKGEILQQGTFAPDNFPGSAQTQVTGINNVGQQVGFYVDQEGNTHGFIENNGAFSAFSTIDAPNTTLTSCSASTTWACRSATRRIRQQRCSRTACSTLMSGPPMAPTPT